ncbi:MAG: hypothetical protein ACR2OU_04685 [Thermomicrobiales bacterium]
MDTVLVILVMLVVIVLLASIGYFFVREAGQENVQEWLTAPKQLKDSVKAFVSRPVNARTIDGREPGVKLEAGGGRMSGNRLPSPSSSSVAVALDDSALRELKEELHGELRHATGLTREFDARLVRMESALTEAQKVPEEVDRALRDQDDRRQREVDRLEQELATIRLTMGTYGERRGEALADFYGHLARVEVAMSAVVNPMLLPGESLTLPPEMLQETLVWNNWSDVGERAFAFGNVFNQNRFVLEPETADQIEAFIVTLRQVLTRDVYPAVRGGHPSAAQIAQMRSGLESIVHDLPIVRRLLENAYRLTSGSGIATDGAGGTPMASDELAAGTETTRFDVVTPANSERHQI